MSASLLRLRAMVVKELWALLRDPRGRITLIVPPIIQLFVFGFAATLEVRNVELGIYDRDGGAHAREVVHRIAGSPNVRALVAITSPTELRQAIDDQRVLGVLSFDPGFSRDVAAGRPARMQAIFDGRRSNAAQIVNGYLGTILAEYGAELRPKPGATSGGSVLVNWFNPNLDYLWFTMPALVVTIGALSVLSVTAQSVARERELGTYDQLMVAPLRTWEVLAGKTLPALLLGLLNASLYLLMIPNLFGVPFLGSVAVFYLAVTCYLMALVGLGLFISTLAHTQQQAFLGMFLGVIPLVLLSGFASPVDNMPGWLQAVAEVNPLKHFMVACEGLFLKAMPGGDVLDNTWPLALIGAATLTGAALFFRARTE